MNLFKRLNNLWKLSEWTPDEIGGGKLPPIKVLKGLIKEDKPRMSQIIKRTTPQEDFLQDDIQSL